MRTIECTFAGGGPLDGRERREFVPDGCEGLRVEHRVGRRLHVYFGLLSTDGRATLVYQGTYQAKRCPK